VYQVEDTHGNVYAIKYNTNSMIADREYEISQLFDNPNIIKYERSDVIKEGVRHVYLRCPYVEDTWDLNEITDVSVLTKITDQLLSAMMAIRKAGYVHMDLNKSNVLISIKNNEPHLYVIDFSITQPLGVTNPWSCMDLNILSDDHWPRIIEQFDVYFTGMYLKRLWKHSDVYESISHIIKAMTTGDIPLIPKWDRIYDMWQKVVFDCVVVDYRQIMYCNEFNRAKEILEHDTYNFDDFRAVIIQFLDLVRSTRGTENKAKVCYILFEYMALTKQFWSKHPTFVDVVKAKIEEYSKLNVELIDDNIPRWRNQLCM
jgi:serine/threonine protein kinase